MGKTVGVNLNLNWRSYAAEFLGTFVFVLVSLGVLINKETFGDLDVLAVGLATGLTYASMVFATIHTSGGHLNPVITLSLWFVRKIRSIDCLVYIMCQLLAGFLATFLLLFIFGNGIVDFSFGLVSGGQEVILQKAVSVEALMSAVLVFAYFSCIVYKRGPVSFGPLVLGFVVFSVYLFSFAVSGGVVNPAKALGPALVSGSYSELTAWIVGPLAGSLFAFVYDFLFLKKNHK